MAPKECMKAVDVSKHFGVKQRTVEQALKEANGIEKILAKKPRHGTCKANRNLFVVPLQHHFVLLGDRSFHRITCEGIHLDML